MNKLIPSVTIIDDLAMICQDCAMLIENGDASDMDDLTERHCNAAIHADAVQGIAWSVNGSNDDGSNDDEEFSCRPCECCGSSLAGSRYAATTIQCPID